MVPKLSASNLKTTIIQDMKPPQKVFSVDLCKLYN